MSNVAVECLREFPWHSQANPPGMLLEMTREQAELFQSFGFVRITAQDPATIPPGFVQRSALERAQSQETTCHNEPSTV